MTGSSGSRDRPAADAQPRARWKRALVNAALFVAALAVVLLCAEAILRTAFDGKYGKRPDFFLSDPTLGWKTSPGLDGTFYGADFSIHVRTDENGYRLGRLGEVDFHKRLVLLAGDSNVFGWGVSTGETMPSYLDELVHDASGGDARVVNLGVGGYGTLQYFVRIRDLVERHPDATIAAVVVVHAPNDAADNLKSVGYYFGAWKAQDNPPKERSSVHLVNLVAYTFQLVRDWRAAADGASKDDSVVHPYLQDMLFSIDTERPKTIHPELDICGRSVSFKNLTEGDWSAEKTFARENLTEIQREMMSASMGCMYTLPFGRGTRIFHLVVPTSPDWFADGVENALREAAPGDTSEVGFHGRLLDPDRYEGQVLNDHTGGHYTPGFNKVWAGKIYELLRSDGVGLSGK